MIKNNSSCCKVSDTSNLFKFYTVKKSETNYSLAFVRLKIIETIY